MSCPTSYRIIVVPAPRESFSQTAQLKQLRQLTQPMRLASRVRCISTSLPRLFISNGEELKYPWWIDRLCLRIDHNHPCGAKMCLRLRGLWKHNAGTPHLQEDQNKDSSIIQGSHIGCVNVLRAWSCPVHMLVATNHVDRPLCGSYSCCSSQSNLSHNQNLVLKWSTQNHVKN